MLVAGFALGSACFGVMVGMQCRLNRLLFELPKVQSLKVALWQTLGLQRTYAAGKQDLWIALSVAPGKRDGYYVDVGSADGILHSNTKLLDSMGWKGVCIDPFPTHMESRTCQLFRQPVFSESGKQVDFRAAGENGGITDTLGRNSDQASKSQLVHFVTATLDEILDKAKAPHRIDFMSIDIEGAEFEALRGLSLDKYEVDAFAIEHNYEKEKREHIRQLLEGKGYILVRSWVTDDWYLHRDPGYEFSLDWGFRR
jgi:FkbM family methyltransferase